MKYTLRIPLAARDVVPLTVVVEEMARHDATCGGTLPLHMATMSERKAIRGAQLVKAAKAGALIVCDSEGCVTPANELIDPPISLTGANMVGSSSNANKLSDVDLLFTRSRHLNDWSQKNTDDFTIVEMPMDVIKFGPRDKYGEFAYRGMVSSICAPAPAQPADTVAPTAVIEGAVRPLGASETPWHLLATPAELIAAFGTSTDMSRAWFNNVKDAPQLMAARHTAGQGGRNFREPLYAVFSVMEWLIDPKRRKGKLIQVATGWRILKSQFPKVYDEYQGQEPDTDSAG